MAKTNNKMVNTGKNKKGQFIEGHINIGGRPKGAKNHDGLQTVLNMLKGLITQEKNLKRLESEMQAALDKNPLGFYYRFIMPLYPKNINLEPTGDLTFIISKDYKPDVVKEKRE